MANYKTASSFINVALPRQVPLKVIFEKSAKFKKRRNEKETMNSNELLRLVVCGVISFAVAAVIAFIAGVKYRMKVAEAELGSD